MGQHLAMPMHSSAHNPMGPYNFKGAMQHPRTPMLSIQCLCTPLHAAQRPCIAVHATQGYRGAAIEAAALWRDLLDVLCYFTGNQFVDHLWPLCCQLGTNEHVSHTVAVA